MTRARKVANAVLIAAVYAAVLDLLQAQYAVEAGQRFTGDSFVFFMALILHGVLADAE